MSALRHLWHRAVHCRRGEHRETVAASFGVLQFRCIDCGAHRMLGWIFVGVSNRKPYPWQRHPDA